MVGFMKSALNLLGIKKEGGGGDSINLDDFLSQLPEQMGYKVKFSKSEDAEKGICYEVEGEEADSFLGNSSEMLDALSHIGMRVLRKSEGVANAPLAEGQEGVRVTFDSKGFRQKKAEELREFAAEQRQKVIDSGGKPAYIPALGPSERKIIHTYLSELGEVLSESIGRGNFKRIRVKLKEDSQYRRAPEPRAEGEHAPREAGAEGAHNNGSGRGGRSGGQGRRRGGRNQNRNRNQRRNPNFQGDRDGNTAPAFSSYQDEEYSNIDDNIGNRLKPGEEPVFRYNTSSSGNKSGDGEYGNN